MTNQEQPASGNPDIFKLVPVPKRLTPYVRRIMRADTCENLDFTFDVCATGYCYLSWVWRGRWTGYVDDSLVFDTESDGRVVSSGQVVNARVGCRISGQPGQIAVEFQPFGQYQLLGIAGDATIDTAIAPDKLNPALQTPLQPLMDTAPHIEGDVALSLMTTFLSDLVGGARVLPPDLLEAVRRMEEADGALRISALCTDLGLSNRTFRRRFHNLTGLTPKRFCRVLQVTKALNAVLERKGASLSEIALKAGFSDQAHFNRAFRDFLHDSPLHGTENVEATLALFVGQARG
ncbi:helix-turn-helix domain-containing protein [Roseovarius sp. Pro17]|uniref:helix-turn-helix domain-containing protein n=1 Tax=Roseovarius sp. Pro17 TaxID=3108175 RepID=UPI002D76AB51|nr:helix-turn-helix domain-containing protein [Roseovarius sp. Pro17]